MKFAVVVEKIEGNGYRATSSTPEQLVAEAATREAALEKLRQLLRRRLEHSELVQLEVSVPGEPHPWEAIFGKLKNHPDAAAVERNIRKYRRETELGSSRP